MYFLTTLCIAGVKALDIKFLLNV
jgi:ABC-type multidrug transport system fused ATPase/permease subunit